MKVERRRDVKEAKSFKEQIEILKSRNIIIENDDFAISILKRVNYYRLSAYMLMHKNTDGNYKNISIEEVYDLYLEEEIDGEWIEIETLDLEYDLAWTDEAWVIPMNDTVGWEIDWEWLYGELPIGRYRMGKEIMDFRNTGDYDTKIYYAAFVIQ